MADILRFPARRGAPPDEFEAAFRSAFSLGRGEYGGDASRDGELCRHLAEICRLVQQQPVLPVPKVSLQWPADLPAHCRELIAPEVQRLITEQWAHSEACSARILGAAVVHVALRLTGADVPQGWPFNGAH